MSIKDFIQNNPFRVLGAFTNDSAVILSSNNSMMKVFAAIGKTTGYPQDMVSVFGEMPERDMKRLSASMAAISLPKDRLLNGFFWFMNITDTDAKALAALAQDGDPLEARHIWEEGEQNMSSLQNQLICCLIKDPRSYSKAIHLACTLYERYGNEFIKTVSNGFEVCRSADLMPLFLTEIIKATDGYCLWWDKAIARHGSKKLEFIWAEVKTEQSVRKLQDALNLAKTSEIRSNQDNYDIALSLMNQAEPHLKMLKLLNEKHPILLSRYAPIADGVCNEILIRDAKYYNCASSAERRNDMLLIMDKFCYRYSASVLLKERCKRNINIILGRKEDAPLLPDGEPDRTRH